MQRPDDSKTTYAVTHLSALEDLPTMKGAFPATDEGFYTTYFSRGEDPTLDKGRDYIYIYVYTFYISYIIIYYNFLSPVCVHVRIPGRTYSHIAIYVLQEVNPTSWTQRQPNYEGRQARRGLALPVFHAAHCLVEVNGGAFIFRHRTDSLSSQAFRNLNMQALGRTGISATFLNNNRLLFHARGAI